MIMTLIALGSSSGEIRACHPKQQSLCAKVLINAKQTLQRLLSRLGNMHGTLQCIHLSMGCTNAVFRPLLIKATCAVGLA